MSFTISEIAGALEARAEGDLDLRVDHAAEPQDAGPGDLALAMKPEYGPALAQGAARAAILWDGADWRGLGLEAAIFVPRPRYAMSGLTALMDGGPQIAEGVHQTAVIDRSAVIGKGARIAPFVVIGPRVHIGAGARIAPHVTIAEDARIGADALLLAGVRIGARVHIGDRFIAQPGAVIGADGFSFVTPDKSGVEAARETLGDSAGAAPQSWTRIHSLGTVEIGDDVELGANATIDRGTIRATRIGRGTKLDNLVHIGHNVEVGEDCLLCGQVGIAGSTKIGNRVVLAGQCGVSDNIFVGDDVVAGGSTKIFSNAPKGRVLLGHPAMRMDRQLDSYKVIRRLPRTLDAMSRDIETLKKAVPKSGDSD